MNDAEFKQAYAIATSDQDLDNVDFNALIGYGLPNFQHAAVPVAAVAKMIRWQTFQFNGGIDTEELSRLRRLFRHRVTVV